MFTDGKKPSEKYTIKKSRRLAWLLRHDSREHFDEHGWRSVEDLIVHHGFTMPLIEHVVEANNKKRFEFNEDKTRIRARQGHSVHVDVELQECRPPLVLYHGTSREALASIMKNGINSGKRLHVHLSADEETAYKVGIRHGAPEVLRINSEKMHTDGIAFYLSNNGVWLTDFIAPEYIGKINE